MIIYNRTEYSKLTDNQYRKEKRRLQVELLKLQEWVVETNQRILILLEGRDAAGKGSIIKRFIEKLIDLARGKNHLKDLEMPPKSTKIAKTWCRTHFPEVHSETSGKRNGR